MASTQSAGDGGMDLSQFYGIFFEEASDNAAQMEAMLLELDIATASDEDLNAIFRCAHSIKGGAATFGFADVAELTHQMESLLDKLRRHELAPDPAMVDVLLESTDAMRALLAVHQGTATQAPPTADLVARIRTQLQQIPIPEPGESASEAAQKRQLMLKHLAELEKKIEQQNASPRTRFVGPSTKEVAYAEFYDQVRLRIEAHGTKHFPSFNGNKLYGSLTMVITIDAFGRVRDVQIAQGSGQPILDHKAVSIVHGSGPFEAFKPDLRKRVDQIAVVARFTFTREGEINSEVAAP